MDILVLGGTRFFGVHLVEALLAEGHRVTIATRGMAKDPHGERVSRITVERTDERALAAALGGKRFDVVCDNLAYCSNDVKFLLNAVDAGRVVMTSSMSVYGEFEGPITEGDFDPLTHKLVWCSRADFDYDEIKRQAECALFQTYSHIPAVAVRFPWIVGTDDYTKRLYFYVEHAIKGIPMHIDNADSRLGFVHAREAGKFVAWLAQQGFTGPVNACSHGTVSIRQVLDHVAQKTGKRALLSPDGDAAPYNGAPSFFLGTQRAQAMGFALSPLEDWFFALLDDLILEVG